MTENRRFPDMGACAAAMSVAADSGMRCYCSVTENPFAPAYYLTLVPLVFVAAVWALSAATARGMAAVVVVVAASLLIPGPVVFRMYAAGIRIPNLLGGIAIGWPQAVLFGPTMFWADPRRGFVLPHQWAPLVTVAFWLVAALVFGALARRLQSPRWVLASAVGFVVAVAIAVRVVAPLFNWQLVMEFP